MEKLEDNEELNMYERPYKERLYELAQRYIEAYEEYIDNEDYEEDDE